MLSQCILLQKKIKEGDGKQKEQAYQVRYWMHLSYKAS